ncbi:hypothetical protein KEM48_011508 [Puccinia striiformis f. sp. tritici PST-130]|nr:hypothetical protein KEM48_011508 [Puccinia striiformis f. sp. tritici PST-130]
MQEIQLVELQERYRVYPSDDGGASGCMHNAIHGRERSVIDCSSDSGSLGTVICSFRRSRTIAFLKSTSASIITDVPTSPCQLITEKLHSFDSPHHLLIYYRPEAHLSDPSSHSQSDTQPAKMSASSDEAHSTSNQTFLSALVINSLVAGVEIIGFIILRRYFRKVYQIMGKNNLLTCIACALLLISLATKLPANPTKRSEPLSSGWISWIPQIIMADDEQIIHHNGLDAYCFLRFLRLLVNIFTPIFVLSWTILLPVYSANSGGTKSGLDMFTFGNIGLNAQVRLTACLILAYVFTCTSCAVFFSVKYVYVLYLLKVEIEGFIKKRQAFLSSDIYRTRPESRTVLLTGIPDDLLDPEALRRFTAHLPGGARRIWVARDIKDLPELYERQQNAFAKLEGAYASLISTVHKAHKKSEKSPQAVPEVMEDGQEWSKYIPRSQRPTHKLGLLGLVGKKVDSIDWASEEVLESTKELESRRTHMEDYRPVNAAFIEFNNLMAAHLFTQSLAHHTPLK